MDLSTLTVSTVIAFLLVLFRIGGMLVSAPLFNMQSIPAQAKVGFAVTMALVLFPLHSANLILPTDLIQLGLLSIQETIIGILLGFTANLTFMALNMAGEFLSIQMGLSFSQVLDPISQTHSPLIGQFFFYFAALLFLNMNIHYGLIVGIDHSFNWIPLGHFIGEGHLTAGLMTQRFIQLGTEMLIMSLTVGVPALGILLAIEIGLGFVAKVMPQMNVFSVAMPLKVGLGLLIMMISVPYFSEILGNQYAHLMQVLLNLYKA